jgi:hypothetical protein
VYRPAVDERKTGSERRFDERRLRNDGSPYGVARTRRPTRRDRAFGCRRGATPTTRRITPTCRRGSVAGSSARWPTSQRVDDLDPSAVPALDGWQREAVLAAASLLRQRFTAAPEDERARTVHDALLEVMEPRRRQARLQRELHASGPITPLALRSERRSRGRRAGTDRREWEFGPPRGKERREDERRADHERRARRP